MRINRSKNGDCFYTKYSKQAKTNAHTGRARSMAEFAWGTVTAVGAAVRDATSDVSVVTPGIGGVDTSVGGKVPKSS